MSSASSSTPQPPEKAPQVLPASSLLSVDTPWDPRHRRPSAMSSTTSLSSNASRKPSRNAGDLATSPPTSPLATGQSSRRTILRGAREAVEASSQDDFRAVRRTRQSSYDSRQGSNGSHDGRPSSIYDLAPREIPALNGRSRPSSLIEPLSPRSLRDGLSYHAAGMSASFHSERRSSKGSVEAVRRPPPSPHASDRYAPASSSSFRSSSPDVSASATGRDRVASSSSTSSLLTPRKLRKHFAKEAPPPLPTDHLETAHAVSVDREKGASTVGTSQNTEAENQNKTPGSKSRIRGKLFGGLRKGAKARPRSPSPSPASRTEDGPLLTRNAAQTGSLPGVASHSSSSSAAAAAASGQAPSPLDVFGTSNPSPSSIYHSPEGIVQTPHASSPSHTSTAQDSQRRGQSAGVESGPQGRRRSVVSPIEPLAAATGGLPFGNTFSEGDPSPVASRGEGEGPPSESMKAEAFRALYHNTGVTSPDGDGDSISKESEFALDASDTAKNGMHRPSLGRQRPSGLSIGHSGTARLHKDADREASAAYEADKGLSPGGYDRAAPSVGSPPAFAESPSLDLSALPSPRRTRRRPQGVYARPLSTASISSTSSWQMPMPRASSLRSSDAARSPAETGPFPTPPPRSSSSSQHGFSWSDGATFDYGPSADNASEPSSYQNVASPALTQGIPNSTSPSSKSGMQKSGSVALLATRFGGATKASLQRAEKCSQGSNAPAMTSPGPRTSHEPLSGDRVIPPTFVAHRQKSIYSPERYEAANEDTLPSSKTVLDRSNLPPADQSIPRQQSPLIEGSQSQATGAPVPGREATPGSHVESASVSPSASNHAPLANPARPAKNPLRPASSKEAEREQGPVRRLLPGDTRQAASSTRQPASQSIEAHPEGLNYVAELGRQSGGNANSPDPSLPQVAATDSRSHPPAAAGSDAQTGGYNALVHMLDTPLLLNTPVDADPASFSASDAGDREGRIGDTDDVYGIDEEEADSNDEDDETRSEDAPFSEDIDRPDPRHEEDGPRHRHEPPTTPGGTLRNLGKGGRLRKATPPALVSAFRTRRPSAGETMRSRKWPFSSKDNGSDGEGDTREGRLLRSARASIRRKKETKQRPEIRRIYDPPLHEAYSETESTVANHDKTFASHALAHQQSLGSLQSGEAGSWEGSGSPAASAVEDRGDPLLSPDMLLYSPLPGSGPSHRPPPHSVMWTKGDLDAETKRMLKRRNVIRELVHTERSYAADLAVIRDIYLEQARARCGVVLSSPIAPPWSPFGSSTPVHSPSAYASQVSGFLTQRNPSMTSSARNARSPSGEVLLHASAHPAHPGLRRKVSSPVVGAGAMLAEMRSQPMPSPSLSGTLSGSARSSVATSVSVVPGSKTDSIASSTLSVPSLSGSLSAGETAAASRSGASSQKGQEAWNAPPLPALPSTPPAMTVSAATSTTSTLEAMRASSSRSTPHHGDKSKGKPHVTVDTRVPSNASSLSAFNAKAVDAPLSASEIRVIFAGVEMCAAFAEEMCVLLESVMGTLSASALPKEASSLHDIEDDTIGTTFRQLCSRIHQVYGAYCSKHEASMSKLRQVCSTSSAAVDFFKECTGVARNHTNAWDLSSLLIKPVQRMLKYPLLLQQIVAATPRSHPDYEHLTMAVEEVQKVADSINELSRRKEIITQIVNGKSDASGTASAPIASSSSKVRTRNGGKLATTKTVRRGKPGKDKAALLLGIDSNSGNGADASSAASWASLAASAPDLLKGDDYIRLVHRLHAFEQGLDSFARECTQWSLLLKASYLRHTELLRAWSDVYTLDEVLGAPASPPDESVAGASDTLAAIYAGVIEGPWTEVDQAINRDILPVLNKIRRICNGPRAIIRRRDEREADYARFCACIERGEKGIDRTLAESANGFAALHMQLLDELPQFILGLEAMVGAVVAAFAQLQSGHYAQMKHLLDAFASKFHGSVANGTSGSIDPAAQRSLSRLPPSANLVRDWYVSHHPVLSSVDQLGICGPARPNGNDASDSRQRPPLGPQAYEQVREEFLKRGYSATPMTASASDSMTLDSDVSSPHLRHLDLSFSSRGASETQPRTTRSSTDQTSFLSIAGSTESPQTMPRLLPVGPSAAAAAGGQSRKGSTAGSLLRSISGTFRSASSSGHTNESEPLPPPPMLPPHAAMMTPPLPPKDRLPDGQRNAPILPSLDLGDGDLSPDVRGQTLPR
ncbi:unnamed protein product [Parajaminaea phylloscopi]